MALIGKKLLWLAFFVFAVAVLIPYLFNPTFPPPSPETSAVFITGTSTGIGFAASRALAAKGFLVFATVRKNPEKYVGPNIHPIVMDVTKPDEIEAAVATVKEELARSGRTLGVLVNNAGINAIAATETLPMAQVRQIFDVNVFGLLQVTRAFLPLLRAHGPGARIINIGSIAGIFTTPAFTTYSASKFAVEALSTGFRRELYDFGIAVTNIQPGAIETPIINKPNIDFQADIQGLSDEEREKLGHNTLGDKDVEAHYDSLLIKARKAYKEVVEQHQGSTDDTDAAILEAATTTRPAASVLVGTDAFVVGYIFSRLPDYVMDVILRL